ncbi:MAG TPA: serine hydrolase [Polyangiaceae bacterium]|nr:serine hydrolase [Polyangiaceae bacterium]HPB97776.1 serine hydrolase [Polyangiaceae bacterium]
MHNVRHCPELDRLAGWCVHEIQASASAVVACAFRREHGWQVDEGFARIDDPNQPEAGTDTLFDLASLTKSFVALAFARLVRDGLVDWLMPLGVPLRDAHGTQVASVPLLWLVAHRAGLEGHRPLYAPLQEGKIVDRCLALRQAAMALRPECLAITPKEDGFPPCYSDLGYLLFGEAMSRASGLPLDEIIRAQISQPLGIQARSARQWREGEPAFVQRTAPTEVVAWRGGLVRGAVHDENAWALGGDGLCGHAGLFATARDVAMLGAAILDALQGTRDDWLTVEQLEPLVRRRPESTLRAGFDGKNDHGSSSAGERCSPDTFGHLGFTGTSFWIDPHAQVVAVLLTNRVYPKRDNLTIQMARPTIHDELFAWGLRHAHRDGRKDADARRM